MITELLVGWWLKKKHDKRRRQQDKEAEPATDTQTDQTDTEKELV
ncbi:MAG: hypothetical protein AAF669_04660 [Pseudomonadota bacterium]